MQDSKSGDTLIIMHLNNLVKYHLFANHTIGKLLLGYPLYCWWRPIHPKGIVCLDQMYGLLPSSALLIKTMNQTYLLIGKISINRLAYSMQLQLNCSHTETWSILFIDCEKLISQQIKSYIWTRNYTSCEWSNTNN